VLLPPFRQTKIASSLKNLEEPSVEVPMLYAQSPPLTAEEPSFGGLARDPDARSDQHIGRRRMKPSIDPPHHYRFGKGPLASGRPSIGRRIFRSLTRFSVAVLIGVCATLGWQSDAAKEMLVARAPTLAWVLSVSTTKSPVVAATSTDPMLQLAPLASNLDVVRRSVEQLAARQEQMAQNIAALKAVEEDIRQRISSTPPAPAPTQQAASIPQPKPRQPKAQSSAVQSSSVPRPPPPAGAQLSR
jgi:hypothetical protein